MTGVLAMLVGARSSPPLAVTANNVEGSSGGFGTEGEVTSSVSPNTTASGGSTPYSGYAWTYVSGDVAQTISSPTAQNPTWTAFVTTGTPSVATWRVTVTDAVSDTAFFDITVTLTWAGF